MPPLLKSSASVRSILIKAIIVLYSSFSKVSNGGVAGKIKVCPGSLVAQMVKSLPAMLEIRVRSLGWEDPLEKEMATHSSVLACRIPWTEEPGGLQSVGSQGVGHN